MKRHKKLTAGLLGLVTIAIVLSVTLSAGVFPTVTPKPAEAAAVPTAPASAAPVVSAATTSTSVAAVPAVILSADFAVGYSTLGQLRQAADVIVRGEVTDVSYLDFNSTAYTKVMLKVSKCLKGDIAAGDEITIMEVGGITSMATIKGDKFGPTTKQDADTKVSVQLDGAPLSRIGDKCIYFLGTGAIGVVPGTYYVPLGAFQGRFKIDNNGVAKRFVPTDWSGGKYTALSTAASSLEQTVAQPASADQATGQPATDTQPATQDPTVTQPAADGQTDTGPATE